MEEMQCKRVKKQNIVNFAFCVFKLHITNTDSPQITRIYYNKIMKILQIKYHVMKRRTI